MNATGQPPVIVIGAGVAGLAAARRLTKAGLPVQVLEASDRVGGRVYTAVHAGMEIDAGAQFIANFYSHTMALVRELGLQSELIPIPGAAAILRGQKLFGLWPDLRAVFTRLISWRSKLLLLRPLWVTLRHWQVLDVHAFHKVHWLDTRSVAAYAHSQLNSELLEYVLQPPLSGIFYYTPEHTSQAMIFPLLKAAVGVRLLTLRHGLGMLPAAMITGLSVLRNAEVTQVTPAESGGYQIKVQIDGQEHLLTARGVVCALPASAVPPLLPELSPRQRAFFQAIGYSANAITALGVNRRLPPEFYGLLFPRQEARHLAIAAVQSAKNPAQVPPGQDLLVLYPSGPAGRRLVDQPDAYVRALLLKDLQAAGEAYQPGEAETFFQVHRWRQALPKFDVGHFRRLKDFADGKIETGRLVFAGDYLGGPFVEGAITSGLQAADRLIRQLEIG